MSHLSLIVEIGRGNQAVIKPYSNDFLSPGSSISQPIGYSSQMLRAFKATTPFPAVYAIDFVAYQINRDAKEYGT
ncbi:MAG: hypothetical protein ACON5D_11180 [Rubripirellula sp.]